MESKAKGEQIDLLHQYMPQLTGLSTAQLESVVLPMIWGATGLTIINFESHIRALRWAISHCSSQQLTTEEIQKHAIITSIHLGISNMHPDTFMQDVQDMLDTLLQEHLQR